MRMLNQCGGPKRIVFSNAVVAALALTQIVAAETVQTVASGLDNPRGLNFAPDGALYVAEAGRGGGGQCAPGPEGTRCYGTSGAITRIDLRNGQKRRVASELPSLASEAGDFAIGPHDITFLGLGSASITIGFSGDPRDRQFQFGAGGAGLAQLAGVSASGNWRLENDLGLYESANNPAGDEIDSNPYGMLQLPGKLIIADAGANDLIQVNANGSITTLAIFPDRLEDAPDFLGLPPGTKIPMDAVPTNVSLGPDGYYYVGQLTGFPFPAGGANVYRVAPGGGTPEVHAGGFSAIVDTAFGPDGSLYVLQLARNGLLDGFIFNNWTGALIRVEPNGTRTELAAGQLIAPGGVAVGGDGNIYVTVNSIYPGTGAVLRIQP